MSRLRSLSFPRLTSTKKKEEEMSRFESPYSAHSRNSSGASSASSPVTPIFSGRNHNRWPSSSSSLATTPDSPVNVIKSALHDLVEDPAEREDGLHDFPEDLAEEPLCICDLPFCEHRRAPSVAPSDVVYATPEWCPGDDVFSNGELPGERMPKRRRSGEYSTESLTSRLSRRWPSISRWKEPKPALPTLLPGAHSAPPTRPSSVRMPSFGAAYMESANMPTLPYTPADSQPEDYVLSRPRALSRPSKPQDIFVPGPVPDPIDRQELASTPLLPPMMAPHLSRSTEELQSPLQSPSIAGLSAPPSMRPTPNSTPVLAAYSTPPLSSKPSTGSPRNTGRGGLPLHSFTDIPALAIADEADYWAIKLGHANFHIEPEPYFPQVCDQQTCRRLLENWESARLQYMRVASRVSEHYGPTSLTYKSTEEKWARIDELWRTYHERANYEAEQSGEVTSFQTLAETQPLTKMPSLNDPKQPSKFPAIADSEIVGPMVKFVNLQRRPSKKPALLKLFTDPASLLGGRSPFSLRR